MTDYRDNDESRGYCPTCGRPLAALDVAGRGVCEEHGRVFADWDSGRLTDSGYENPSAYDKPGSAYANKDYVCTYPACDCAHICRATGREVGRERA